MSAGSDSPDGSGSPAEGSTRVAPAGLSTANSDDVRRRFARLNVWSQNGSRAPHKPLLVLWAIGRCLADEPRMAPFSFVDRELTALLRSFGPRRKGQAADTQDPFWRLRNDGVWQIDRADLIPPRPGKKAYRKDLLFNNIHGGLLEADYDALRRNPALAWRLARSILEAHFPATLHDDILRATGIEPVISPFQETPANLDAYVQARRRRRDAMFRQRVLWAYGSQCAVCRFAVRDREIPCALEAAHIKWHQARGPDEVANGLALCALHHRLFDGGVFTLLPGDYRVAVADVASGEGFEEWLGRFAGLRLRVTPSEARNMPKAQFLRWHGREVFRSPESVR